MLLGCLQRPGEDVRLPGARITGVCKPSDLGAGNCTWDLRKSSKSSLTFQPPFYPVYFLMWDSLSLSWILLIRAGCRAPEITGLHFWRAGIPSTWHHEFIMSTNPANRTLIISLHCKHFTEQATSEPSIFFYYPTLTWLGGSEMLIPKHMILFVFDREMLKLSIRVKEEPQVQRDSCPDAKHVENSENLLKSSY